LGSLLVVVVAVSPARDIVYVPTTCYLPLGALVRVLPDAGVSAA